MPMPQSLPVDYDYRPLIIAFSIFIGWSAIILVHSYRIFLTTPLAVTLAVNFGTQPETLEPFAFFVTKMPAVETADAMEHILLVPIEKTGIPMDELVRNLLKSRDVGWSRWIPDHFNYKLRAAVYGFYYKAFLVFCFEVLLVTVIGPIVYAFLDDYKYGIYWF